MKILVLSGFDDNMLEVGVRCTNTHRAYAARNNYAHEVVRDYLPDTHPSWQKLRLLKERIDQYDAILWLDADSVVTNPTVTVESLISDKILTCSVDWCAPVDGLPSQTKYISMGNFILRNTPDTHRFLDMCLAHTIYARKSACCWEQDAVLKNMHDDPWFDGQVYRHPRVAMNAVHETCCNRNFPKRAPFPWSPGDFLIHLTNVADRVALAEEYSYKAVEYLTPWIPEWWEVVMCADKRHVRWLHDVCADPELGIKYTMEAGVWEGTTSSAFIRAGVPYPAFVDIDVRERAKRVIGPLLFIKGEGRHHMAEGYDLIFIDSDHQLKTVEPETNAVLKADPRIIVAHDVTATVAGFGHCEGAAHLWHRLQQEGWLCVVDSKVRPGERTDRGMLMATKDPGIYRRILRHYTANCW